VLGDPHRPLRLSEYGTGLGGREATQDPQGQQLLLVDPELPEGVGHLRPALRGQHGVPWLVELTALIGHYGIVSGILNAFEVAPAPDAEQLPLA